MTKLTATKTDVEEFVTRNKLETIERQTESVVDLINQMSALQKEITKATDFLEDMKSPRGRRLNFDSFLSWDGDTGTRISLPNDFDNARRLVQLYITAQEKQFAEVAARAGTAIMKADGTGWSLDDYKKEVSPADDS